MNHTQKNRYYLAACIASALFLARPVPLDAAEVVTATEKPRQLLGPPITFDEITLLRKPQPSHPTRATNGTGNFGLSDLNSRHQSKALYKSIYGYSENIPFSWKEQGSTSSCTTPNIPPSSPGEPSDEYTLATHVRINYFRAMAGVNDDIQLDSSYNSNSQSAAIFQSSNLWNWMQESNSDWIPIPNAFASDESPHNPPTDWNCYTTTLDSTSDGNISWGNAGYDAVMSQMRDSGKNNVAAGHRRWLLYPTTTTMGVGSVDQQTRSGTPDYYPAAAVIYTADTNPTAQRTVEGSHIFSSPLASEVPVAWPPAGYVPYQVVYPRWSFSYPDADFGTANVIMLKNGTDGVNVEIEQIKNGVGENTLVWVPMPETMDENQSSTKWPNPGIDTAYDVIIQDVSIDNVATTFSYTVTVFDPDTVGDNEVIPSLTGDSEITTNGPTLHYTPVSFAEDHEVKVLTLEEYSTVEGAETPLTNVTDGTHTEYSLQSDETVKSGSYSFNLSHYDGKGGVDQFFQLDETFLLSASSTLDFWSLISWSTSNQFGKVQISLDDGSSWADIYSRAGSSPQNIEGSYIGPGESSFSNQSISLADYADTTVLFRFLFTATGSYISRPPTNPTPIGFYIDDIQITGAQRIASSVEPQSIGTSGDYLYSGPSGSYGLQLRAVPWSGFPELQWGTVKKVTVSQSTCTNTDTNLEVTQDLLDTCSAENPAIREFHGNSSLFTFTDTVNWVTIPSDGFPWGFTSGGTITLNPGFKAVSGSDFSATITP